MRLERYVLPAVLAVSAGVAIASGVIFDNNDNQITVTQVAGQTVIHHPEWNNVVIHDNCRTAEVLGGIAAVASAATTIFIRRRFK